MNTVVEPQHRIVQLWSKLDIRDGETIRMMRYVIRVDQEDKVLLHNVVTGQLVILDQNEAELLDELPQKYTPAMKDLVDGHYLVKTDYNEHLQVVKMREVLRKLWETHRRAGITHYTILPTTACNARCYYCFEQGTRITTMSEQTANEVVEFIKNHAEGQRILIRWFGGEPTLAVNRIDQICKGLQQSGIDFLSIITTNGYLFDAELVRRIQTDWHLTSAMISVDGTGDRYNRIKAYVNATDDPYQRVLQNIRLLIEHHIEVKLRLNFDKNNYQDFEKLLDEVMPICQNNSGLQVFVHEINEDYPVRADNQVQGDESWFRQKIFDLNELSRSKGMLRANNSLPSLRYRGCEACEAEAVVITPEGFLVNCPEQTEKNQAIGDLTHGIIDTALSDSWKIIEDNERCQECVLYPDCVRVSKCNGRDRCFNIIDTLSQYKATVLAKAAGIAKQY